MNILQVVPELNAGGVERTVLEINEALTLAGHGSHVASEGGRLEDLLRESGAILHTLPIATKNPLHLRRNTKALIDLIKSEKIDIVHARSRAPAWAAKAAAEACNVKFVTTYHGIYSASSRLKRRYNAVMTKGDAVIANSEFTKAHIIKEHSTEPEKITVIPRGVDIALFNPNTIDPAAVTAQRRDWQCPDDRPLLLLPGRLTRWKGQLLAIEALGLLHAQNQTAHLVLLGDPQGRNKYVAEIKAAIKAHGLAPFVHIAPHTQNMPIAYASTDLVLMPSTEPEAFGRVAAEAGAIKKIAIAAAHGGATESVIDGTTGFLFTPNDPVALSESIHTALTLSPSSRTKIEKAAHNHIAKNFSKTALQSATLSLYAHILTN